MHLGAVPLHERRNPVPPVIRQTPSQSPAPPESSPLLPRIPVNHLPRPCVLIHQLPHRSPALERHLPNLQPIVEHRPFRQPISQRQPLHAPMRRIAQPIGIPTLPRANRRRDTFCHGPVPAHLPFESKQLTIPRLDDSTCRATLPSTQYVWLCLT